jgi:hypothetical protein
VRAIVHVHQQKIRKGEPAIIVRTYKGSTHHSEIKINGPSRMVHSATPDSCGARVWIEVEDASTIEVVK